MTRDGDGPPQPTAPTEAARGIPGVTGGALAPGTRVDRYVIERAIGEGGLGAVYAARHVHTGRPVALKVVRESRRDRDDLLERFRREARALGQLGSPHIVQVLDFGICDGRPFLVMELLEGQSLRAILDGRGRLTAVEALAIADGVLEALGAAHAAGVIHRDVKPDNVFLAGDVVKLLDFGVSKLAEGPALTGTHGFVGTPAYAAPEQLAGGAPADERADLYAVCLLLYRMLSGRLPYATGAGTFGEMVAAIGSGRRTPLAEAAPEVAPALCAVVDRGLARNPAGRPASAIELKRALSEALARSAPPSDPERGDAGPRTIVLVGLGLSAVGVLAVAGYLAATSGASSVANDTPAPLPTSRPAGSASPPPIVPVPLDEEPAAVGPGAAADPPRHTHRPDRNRRTLPPAPAPPPTLPPPATHPEPPASSEAARTACVHACSLGWIRCLQEGGHRPEAREPCGRTNFECHARCTGAMPPPR